jgi:hypothetical protein
MCWMFDDIDLLLATAITRYAPTGRPARALQVIVLEASYQHEFTLKQPRALLSEDQHVRT